MASFDLSKLHLLTVDDNQNMLHLIGAALSAFGVTKISVAHDARQAFLMLRDSMPDMVLCDLHMESGDGINFLRRVRLDAKSPNPYLPVIMVSGHAQAEKVALARDAGANDFLVKPISAKSLYQRLAHAIEKPRPFVRSSSYFGPCRRRLDKGPPEGVPERRADAVGEVEYL